MQNKNPSTAPKHAQSKWAQMKCAHCSEEFRVPKSQARQRFCSTTCANRMGAMRKKERHAQIKKTPDEVELPPKSTFPKTPAELVAFRRALGIIQRDFWARLGVTQSGGSRYEQGRAMPPAVAILLDVVYVKGVTLARLASNDFATLEFLKSQHPDLYMSLEKAARGVGRVLY